MWILCLQTKKTDFSVHNSYVDNLLLKKIVLKGYEIIQMNEFNKNPNKEILNFEEVCKLLGICRNTLTKMMNNNEVKYCKLGAQYKFRYCDIMALFNYNSSMGVS